MIWKKIAKKFGQKPVSFYNKFQMLKENLMFLHKHQKEFIVRKEVIQGCQEEFVPNTDGFDDKLYCICRKEWKGEVMVECCRCEQWFHPACLGLDQITDTALNMIEVHCPKCKSEYEREYGDLFESLPVQQAPQFSFNYQLVNKLEEILALNKQKPSLRMGKKKTKKKTSDQGKQKKFQEQSNSKANTKSETMDCNDLKDSQENSN